MFPSASAPNDNYRVSTGVVPSEGTSPVGGGAGAVSSISASCEAGGGSPKDTELREGGSLIFFFSKT